MPNNHHVAGLNGYGQSKHVAECVLRAAWETCDLPVTVLRVGQIAGSTNATDPAWPANEWFPMLVRSSQEIGYLPGDLPMVDFVPINLLVDVITELITTHPESTSTGLDVFNLVNPRPTAWSKLRETVRASCGPETKLVPMLEWMKRLKEAGLVGKVERLPALKLLPLYEEIARAGNGPKYEIAYGVAKSKAMRDMSSIDEDMMTMWVEHWNM